MGNLWERFDDIADVNEVVENKSKFKPLEAGIYKAKLERLEAGESKNGQPMLKSMFRTEDNRVIFDNKFLQSPNPEWTANNIAQAVAFLEGVRDELIEYDGLGGLAKLIAEMQQEPDNDENNEVKEEWAKLLKIEVKYGNKDTEHNFPKVSVIEHVEETPFDDGDPDMVVEDDIDFDEDDVPF
jgi:hypothetical protein